MVREEPRTGRIADSEFMFWECWESDDNVPAAPERHWFRSDTGLEAATYDHMLQMLYRQHLGLPIILPVLGKHIPSATSEWDKRTPCTVRVRGEDVVLQICEHFSEERGGALVSVKVVGPNGLVTSSYQEMLELLGVAEERQSAVGNGQSAKTEDKDKDNEPTSHSGNLVASSASKLADSDPGAQEQPGAGSRLSAESEEPHSACGPACSDESPAKTHDKNSVVAIVQSGPSETEDFGALDARDMQEARVRGEEFEERHPWLWGEDREQECDEPINSMRFVWWGEYIKAVYPELAAAALDPEKYQAYIDNYDYERPIPLNEPDDDEQQVGAEAPRCQYIKADGEQCGCPALKRKRLCYFHSKTAEGRKRKKNGPTNAKPDNSPDLELPVLEDDRAIQMAVTNICRQLAKESIEPKRASTLLYGLQVAAVAVRRTAQKSTERFSNHKIF